VFEPDAENTKISEIKAEANPCKVATPQPKDKTTPCVNKSFSKLIVGGQSINTKR
jgi:hypothetical protein